ncbi:MAG: TRAP transporter small permease subunit [Marinovum algicola]|jgi:TRAP-type mannitol/chloroaromatic compound transport system permease small subunit|uniref:TRAP transporter small permease subunit n=1 Tax=Alphaproteobacteria TaxID=28211 RepID=UPI0032D947D1
MLQSFANLCAALPRAGHFVGGWLLFCLAFVIGYDVVGRKFFNTGSTMLQELQWHLHGAAMLLGFGATYLKDAHVRVDLLRGSFPPRAKIWLEVLGIILFLIPYLGFLFHFSIDYALRAWATGEGSVGGGGLPNRWIIKSFLAIGFALVILSALSILARCIDALRTGGKAPETPFFPDP